MRVGLAQMKRPEPQYLMYAAQFGATDIVLNRSDLPVVDGVWPLHEIVKYRFAHEPRKLTSFAPICPCRLLSFLTVFNTDDSMSDPQ